MRTCRAGSPHAQTADNQEVRALAVATSSGVRIGEIAAGRPLWSNPVSGIFDGLAGVALDPEGRSLCVATGHTVQIWDLSDRREPRLERTLTGLVDDAYDCAFSPDGTILASASGYFMASGEPPDGGNEVRLWDRRTGRAFLHYRSAGHVVDRVLFGGDNGTLIAASLDGWVRTYRCDACAPAADLPRLAGARGSRNLSEQERLRYIPPSGWLHW